MVEECETVIALASRSVCDTSSAQKILVLTWDGAHEGHEEKPFLPLKVHPLCDEYRHCSIHDRKRMYVATA